MLEFIKHLLCCKYTKIIREENIQRIRDGKIVGILIIKECEICGKLKQFTFGV